MQTVIGVRFQEAGKIYYFSPAGFEDVEVGEYVVVETSRGLEVSRVVIAPDQVVNAELSEPLKPVTRMASLEDLERAAALRERARTDLEVVRRVVHDRNVPMKVINGSYNLDGSRLTIFFTSEGRVDFRDLLRDLSHQLHTQVQLRQVGPRDQAKAVDGYGRCGRRLCCSSWLVSFPSITIKMAKEQNLVLNPSKISGQCGRLLCCLAYEDDTYRQLKAMLPRPGTLVSTPSGGAKVLAVNALRQLVTLQMETFEIVEVPASALALDRGVVRIVSEPDNAPEESPPPTPPPAAERPPRPQGQRPPSRREPPVEAPRPAPHGPQPPRSAASPVTEPAAAGPDAEQPAPAPQQGAPTEVKPAAQQPSRARRHRRGGSRRRGKGGHG